MFWRLDLATCWRLTPVAKNTCLAKTESVFKSFQFSLELFMTIHFLSQVNLTQTLHVILYKLHCCTCSPPNLQEKRYGLLFSHLISLILSFIFMSICVGVLIVVVGLFQWFCVCSCFDYLRYCSHAQTYFSWWFHIFSSICFLEITRLPDLCLMYNHMLVSFIHSIWT